MLNIIWIGFFLAAAATALYQIFFLGNPGVLSEIMDATFTMSKTAFDIAIGLTGVMTLWLGLIRIGEAGGAIAIITRLISPCLTRLFPEVPRDHPAHGAMIMNLAANMLGLDNAATPLGLKAMNELQQLNPEKDTASNAQIMFLVINTSSVTLIPVSIFTYLYQIHQRCQRRIQDRRRHHPLPGRHAGGDWGVSRQRGHGSAARPDRGVVPACCPSLGRAGDH